MKNIRRVANLIVATAFAGLAHAQETGSIAGQVLDDNNMAVGGAVVLYNNLPDFQIDSTGHLSPVGVRIASGLRTNPDGTFAITGLPEGKYQLCASGIKPNQLLSCEWGQLPELVVLSPGQAVTNILLKAVNGTLLVFNVSDPQGLIQDTGAGPLVNGLIPLSGGNFRIGVVAGGPYARAQFMSVQNGIWKYAVAVPKYSLLQLFVDTPLQIFKSGAVAAGQPSLPIVVNGQAELDVDLQVQ